MEKEKMTGYPSIDKPWLKYYSEEAINSPLPECTVYEYLWENNKDHFVDIALNYFGKKITYGKLFDNIKKAASAFSAIGVKEGDIVAMVTVTTPETIFALYGLNRLGAVSNMIDPRTNIQGIRDYIMETEAKYVLTLSPMASKIEKAVIETLVKKIIVVSPSNSLPIMKRTVYKIANHSDEKFSKYSDAFIWWDEFIRNGLNTKPDWIPYKKDTCCVICHTGGTTGVPKSVMLSNDNLNAAVKQSLLTGIELKRKQTWLNIMPPFIAYGIGNGLMLPLVCGMEVIIIPQFDPDKFVDILLKHRPNHMVGVPSHYENIIHNSKISNENLAFIIAPMVGGDTMRSELEEETNKFLKKHNCSYNIFKGYGMTEVCAAVSTTISNEINCVGSVGIPFTHTVISIFDTDTGEEVPYNVQGEICMSGPNTMLGYYKNKYETENILKLHSDGNLWVHSGDIGYMNENGMLFVIGRRKRMIIRYDGFKIFPSFIENVVTIHEAVISCCAVGILDKNHTQGELPAVFIVLKPEYKGQEREIEKQIIEFCHKNLPEYAQPAYFKFIQELPLTPIGKIDYSALKNC